MKRPLFAEVAIPRPSRLVIELREVRARLVLDGAVDREALATVLTVLREAAR